MSVVPGEYAPPFREAHPAWRGWACLLKGGRQMQEKSVWSLPRPPHTHLEHLFSVTLMRGRGIAVGEGVR